MKLSNTKIIAILLLFALSFGVLTACSGGTAENSSSQTTEPNTTNSETESSEESSKNQGDTSEEESSEKESETLPPSIEDIENGVLIENAYGLANGVNAYFTNGNRTDFVLENQEMRLEYALANYKKQLVTSLTDKKGNTYIEGTSDVFVRMKDGNVFYASNSSKAATANLYRFGYYMYEARFEEQLFSNEVLIKDSKDVSLSGVRKNQAKVTSLNDGSIQVDLTNSDDPFISFSNINYSADDYKFIQITMKMSSLNMRSINFYLAAGNKTSIDGSQSKYFTISPGDEFQTYTISLEDVKDYYGTLSALRLDFTGSKGDRFVIQSIKLIKGESANIPKALELNRSFYVYSNKMHQVVQVATREIATNNIDAIGIKTDIAADTVEKIIIKDKNGTHSNLDGIDWASVEYVGFDIKNAGIFGYILPADNSGGTLEVTLEDGKYTVIQSKAPENGTINPSGTYDSDKKMIVPTVSNNGNDFFMGQRIYTDGNHDFDEFLAEAENERNPLDSENFIIDTDNSTKGSFAGYDALRGIYVLNLDSGWFNACFFQHPNKYFNVRFTVKGDNADRNIYVMAASTSGCLECAVLLDENNMMLPIPIEVGKNFSEAGGERNLWNIEDIRYNEAIIPMLIQADSSDTYNFLNLYQNWGRFPLKQISWIQFYAPYYHLSTGVTETNCIIPYYSCKNVRGLATLPDHRPMSAPFWSSEPQHNSGGSHIWLVYTDANGVYAASENTKNVIDSYGPIYADVTMDYLSDDGKIKIQYTHTEFPQTDENRAYYEMKYEILEDLEFTNFSEDFHFYKVTDNDPTGIYQNVGYLNENNEGTIVAAAQGKEKNKYVLGDQCPYFSFFNMKDYSSTGSEGYTNLSFLVYNSEFVINGQKVTPNFVIVNENNYVRISLNLEKVTLKAGDSFTINCIVMPWGSQESIYDSKDFPGDHNVREVRENTLLNPLTPKAVENCTVLESAFVPKLKTTNGKDATFTLTGGQNNVAVRIYGFDKLSVPVIEELVNGEWVVYNTSSAYYPDYQGNAHYFDGYSVYYDQNGTFSYAFIAEMDYKNKDGRTFRISVAEDFTKWPEKLPEVNDGTDTDPLNVYLDANDLGNAASMSSQFGGIDINNDENYVSLYSNGSSIESYFLAYPGGKEATGQYLVMKYRLPTTNNAIPNTEIFTSTVNDSAKSEDIFYISSGFVNDGNWHVVIVDLGSWEKASFAPADDGTYTAKFVRLDVFNLTENGNFPSGNRIDIEFMGLSDDQESIYALAKDLESVQLVKKTDGSVKVFNIDPKTKQEISD